MSGATSDIRVWNEHIWSEPSPMAGYSCEKQSPGSRARGQTEKRDMRHLKDGALSPGFLLSV